MGKGDDEDPDLTYSRRVGGFYLDRFEVTVGRFMEFIANYRVPSEGDGQHPRIPVSGWQESWESLPDFDHPGETAVPPTHIALQTQVGGAEYCPMGSFNDGLEALPINCVNWYVAFAFCVFDGGRLPTEAEWNYAAAFGNAHRPYPWSQSVSDLTVDTSLATYYSGDPPLEQPTPVGSHPGGQGGFHRNVGQGHEDLAGNVFEWVADQWVDEPEESCGQDCMAAWSENDDQRPIRGGSFESGPDFMRSGRRASSPAYNIVSRYGIRCARDSVTE
jgi:formylglycine-generating enzyme required for sulfatase activity